MMMKRTRREVVFDHFDYTSHVKLGGGLTPGDVFFGDFRVAAPALSTGKVFTGEARCVLRQITCREGIAE